MSDDWEEPMTEEEENEGTKGLFLRPNCPNDIRSPYGAFTAHDRLRVLGTSLMMELRKDEELADQVHRLVDVVEDHERLLTLVTAIRDTLRSEVQKLDGAGAMLNVGKVREQLRASLMRINGEMSRLYLDEI